MGKPLRVLMVEDSEDDVLLMIRALKQGGYDPIYERVEDALSMRKALEKGSWDIILCDYSMPQFDGLAAIALLKETGIDIPLIMVSGVIGEETAVACMRQGAQDYVMKDNLSRLVPAIERELKEAESRSQSKQVEEALRESDERYKALFDRSLDCVYVHDFAGNFLDANNAALNLLGYRREKISSLNFATLLSEDQMPLALQALQELIDTGYQKNITEYRLKARNGDDVFVETIGSVILRKGIASAVLSIARNITERKRLEGTLRESEKHYRYLFENMLNGYAYCKMLFEGDRPLDFIYLDVNSAFETLTGLKNVAGKKVSEAIPGLRESDMGLLEIYGRVALTGKPEQFEKYIEALQMWFSVSVYSPEKEHFVALFDVITDRKRAEEKLKDSKLQFRALAARQQQIREEMMVMIARDIHDDLGGGLTGLKMDLSWLLNKLKDTEAGEERVALVDKIHASNALVDQMIHSVRRISTDLRPSILEDLGLVAALEWQLSEFTRRTKIQHELATTVEYVNMEETTSIAVFRIFQEALTNVARHSEATKVAVAFKEGERSLFGDENLILEIRDNGRGITDEEILNPESLGLLGMKERVLAFGGELSIRGEPGGGTTLILKVPRIKGEPQ